MQIKQKKRKNDAFGFLSGSVFSEYSFRRILVAAGERSAQYGLKPNAKAHLDKVFSQDQLEVENSGLLRAARPVLNYVAKQLQVQNSNGILVLANSDATIVATAGDDSYLLDPSVKDVVPGVSWLESERGTNALGSAIVEKKPVLLDAGDHYLDRLHNYSCSSVLIEGHDGECIGAICLTRAGELPKINDGMTLLTLAARHISQRYFLAVNEDHLVIAVHKDPEWLETPWEGLLAINPSFEVVNVNKSACHQLKLARDAIIGQPLSSLLGDGFINEQQLFTKKITQCALPHDPQSNLHCKLVKAPHVLSSAFHVPINTDVTKHTSRIAFLNIEHTQECKQLQQRFNKSLPIILLGEPGVGKRKLALMLHANLLGNINSFHYFCCATLSPTAMEEQLFGKPGRPQHGFLYKANGGTVFLDAIHAMPAAVQYRLLRCLQRKSLQSSDGSVDFNVRIIASSSRALGEVSDSNELNQLFFSFFGGAVMEIPPLRERSDIAQLCEDFFHEEGVRSTTISDQLMAMFEQYQWPGNIRQLRMILRTLLSQDHLHGQELTFDSLPASLKKELQTGRVDKSRIAGTDLQSKELQAIQEAIQRNQGNMSAAARELNVSRATLYRKIKLLEN